MHFYQLTPQETLRHLRTGVQGLSNREAKARLERDGPNLLKVKGEPWWRRLLRPFSEVMVIVLLLAAAIGVWQKEYFDSLVVIAIIIVNALINWGQQFSTEKILRSLKKIERTPVRVCRDGAVVKLEPEHLVVGDVLVLSEGQKIPADARLVEVNNLYTDEAMLTGESSSVRKKIAPLKGTLPTYQQQNCVFSETFVVTGTAKAVVTATGNQTVFGSLALLATSERFTSPMQTKVNRLIKQVVGLTFGLSALTFALSLYRGLAWDQALRFVIALAVSAVPEGLPVAITVVLALGMRRLAHEKALVRNLSALENIGLVTTIATDKTGTLTYNKLQVQQTWSPHLSRLSFTRQLKLAINHTQGVSSDPLDTALTTYTHQAGVNTPGTTLIQTFPFDYRRACSGNLYWQGKNYLAVIKGAPEKIIKRLHLSRSEHDLITNKFAQLVGQGFRVIALTRLTTKNLVRKLASLPRDNWEFLGLVAIADGLKPGVASATKQAKLAGVKVQMITGDHQETAWHIAAAAGIATGRGQVINAHHLQSLSETKFAQIAREARVFARVLPEVKYHLLTALNKKEITAMTGDGVNDVPALSRAHVGIAMGSGAQIAKEASDIILLDDNFRTIITAVREGRIIIDNVRRMLIYLLATNAGEILVMIGALLLGLPLPVLAVQILWINLVTDTLMVIPLGLEPGNRQIMNRPPEKIGAPVLSPYLLGRVILLAGGLAAVTLAIFTYYLTREGLATAQTMAFLALIAGQLINAFALRHADRSLWQPQKRRPNTAFNLALLAALGLQILVFITPLRLALHLQPLNLSDISEVILPSLAVPLILLELHKWWGNFKGVI